MTTYLKSRKYKNAVILSEATETFRRIDVLLSRQQNRIILHIKIFIDYDLSLLERKTGTLFITQKKVQNWRWLDSSSFPYRYYIFCFRRKDTCGTGKILPAPALFASPCGRPRSCQIWFYLLPARGPSFPHNLSLWLRLVDHSGT